MSWESRLMPKGQKTRERIVAEAASLFNQRGFEASSMSELKEATGLEKGGIYRHFSSKEELAAKAFDYAWKVTLGTRVRGCTILIESQTASTSLSSSSRILLTGLAHRFLVAARC